MFKRIASGNLNFVQRAHLEQVCRPPSIDIDLNDDSFSVHRVVGSRIDTELFGRVTARNVEFGHELIDVHTKINVRFRRLRCARNRDKKTDKG